MSRTLEGRRAGALVLAWIGVPAAVLLCASPAYAQGFNSTSSGADGALTFAPGQGAVEFTGQGLDADGDGVYQFTSITVGTGTTVRLSASTLGEGQEVVWLASGAVTIEGSLDLSGKTGHTSSAVPVRGDAGAGGYFGGPSGSLIVRPKPGNGPGGGNSELNKPGGGAGHLKPGPGPNASLAAGGPSYGNDFLLPISGGSGGGAGWLRNTTTGEPGGGGGGGGGAILIASSVSITVTGSINARGGSGGSCNLFRGGGGGSGGSIRLMAPEISGAGSLNVSGGATASQSGPGSAGRVRVEAFRNSLTSVSPSTSAAFARPGVIFLPANGPRIRVTTVGGVAVAANPKGGFIMPDVVIDAPDPVTIDLAAQNIPLGTQIVVRLVADNGATITVSSAGLSGTVANSTASTAPIQIPTGFSQIFVTAKF